MDAWTPERRAEALLRSVLGEADWRTLRETGQLRFTGSLGTPFILYRERQSDPECKLWLHGHTFNLGIVGQPDSSYGACCFVYFGSKLPRADELVMLYLTAKYDEAYIRDIKAHHEIRWGPRDELARRTANKDGRAEDSERRWQGSSDRSRAESETDCSAP